MDQTPQTSFIPRQTPTGQPVVRRRRRFNVLGFFAVIIFLGSVALAIGSYVYEQIQARELRTSQTSLSEKQGQFKQEDVDRARALDTRIETAKKLLDSHISPSLLFDVLERSTQSEVQFVSMKLERKPSGNVAIGLEGKAPNFSTVAQQAQRFAGEKLLERVIFSKFNKDSTGIVSFHVDVEISPAAFAYTVVGTTANPEPVTVQNPASSAPTTPETTPTTDSGTSTVTTP